MPPKINPACQPEGLRRHPLERPDSEKMPALEKSFVSSAAAAAVVGDQSKVEKEREVDDWSPDKNQVCLLAILSTFIKFKVMFS